MPNSPIGKMLQSWQRHSIEHSDLQEFPVALGGEDIIRLKALAEIYHLPLNDVVANLIHSALQEVETRMPYIPGDRIIRVEEGEPVYEDIGLTPRYLAAKERLEKNAPA